MELQGCPLCGAELKIRHIGNDYTKSRKLEVSCPECRIHRADATIRHGFEWLEDLAEKFWNQWPQVKG
jgi:hypothetical protein